MVKLFSLSSNIGNWSNILDKHMKKSRFLKQDDLNQLKKNLILPTIEFDSFLYILAFDFDF